MYQGRVYSISGKDSRYPSLYQTAFKSGYSIIHPNCRHSWSPYHAELYTDDEKREALERSNRSWKPDGNGRNFQQMEKAREAYAIGQQKQREWNAEILEYERMKAHYKDIGEEPPYQTLGAFRREVRKPKDEQSVAMKAWKRHYGDQQQYEQWEDVVGAENMPNTLAKFQQIKYNGSTQEQYARLEKTFQGYSEYKRDNPDCTPSEYRTALKLKEQGVKGTIHIPPQTVDTKKYIYNDEHINTERQHGVSREEAESYIDRAVVSITQWKGQRIAFYSKAGVTVVDLVKSKIVTSWSKDEFDDNVKSILKEIIGSGEE